MIGDRHLDRRRFTATIVKGKTLRTWVDEPIVGSVQPASGKVLEDLGGGRRSRAAVVLRTCDDIRTADAPGVEADHVLIEGEEWVAMEVLTWSTMFGTREVLLVRELEGHEEAAA